MVFTPIVRGTDPWDVLVNDAFTDQDSRITANNTSINRLTLNVMSYGAVGNGVTDDSPAIQAALDAAYAQGGGTVTFPAGHTYVVYTPLEVLTNVTVSAYGASIRAGGDNSLIRFYRPADSFTGYNGHHDIRVLGGTWDANAFDAGVGTVTSVINAFTCGHNQYLTIRDATITNVSGAHGVDCTSSQYVLIENCKFLGFKDNTGDSSRGFSEAVQLDLAIPGSGSVGTYDGTPAADVTVSKCTFGPSSRLGPFGRAVGSHTSASGTYIENVKVLDNTIVSAGQEGIRPYGWSDALISGNIIQGWGTSGINITGPDPAVALYNLACRRVTVVNNFIAGTGSGSPIRAIGFSTARSTEVIISNNTVTQSSGSAVFLTYLDNPLITDNVVSNAGSLGINVENAISPTISNNTVKSSGSTAIQVAVTTANALVEGNKVITTTSGHGISMNSATGGFVQGNRIIGAFTNGIFLAAGATGTVVSGNRIDRNGVTVNGINIGASSTGCKVVGNFFEGAGGWTDVQAIANAATTIFSWSEATVLPGDNIIV